MVIEVELKGLISQKRYDELFEFFTKNAKLIGEDNQETHYFKTEDDLRIQKNDYHSKIILKKGQLHDEMREELEIKSHKDDFDNLQKLFGSLGYTVEIKWFRKRHSFEWEGVRIDLDSTKGFGNVLEIEKMADEDTKNEALALVKEKFQKLGVPISTKEELKEKFEHYRDNWKTLIE